MGNLGDVRIVGKCGRFWVRGTQIPSSFSGQKGPIMDAKSARFLFAKKGLVGLFFMEGLLRDVDKGKMQAVCGQMQHPDWSTPPGHFPALKVVVYLSERRDTLFHGHSVTLATLPPP